MLCFCCVYESRQHLPSLQYSLGSSHTVASVQTGVEAYNHRNIAQLCIEHQLLHSSKFSILLSQLTAHVCAAAGTVHLMCWHYGRSNTPLVSTLMTLCDLEYARCYTWQTESDTYQKCACRLFQSPFSKHHQISRRHLVYVCCSMVLSQCSWSHTTNVSNARKMCSQATSNMDHAVVHYQCGSSSRI